MHESTTQLRLLERLRKPEDEESWARFVELYTPLFYFWARQANLDQNDASDLIQDVFVTLVRHLPSFERQPGKRFRGWLQTIFTNRLRERFRRMSHRVETTDRNETVIVPTPDSIEELVEKDYRNYLVQRALQLMQAHFEPTTWKACWEFVVVGRPASVVAEELGISPNSVYLAKSRVLRHLRTELEGLLE